MVHIIFMIKTGKRKLRKFFDVFFRLFFTFYIQIHYTIHEYFYRIFEKDYFIWIYISVYKYITVGICSTYISIYTIEYIYLGMKIK